MGRLVFGPITSATFWNFIQNRLNGWIGFDHRASHRADEVFASLSHFFVSGLHTWILHCFLSGGLQFLPLFWSQICQALLPAAAATSFGPSWTLREDDWGELQRTDKDRNRD